MNVAVSVDDWAESTDCGAAVGTLTINRGFTVTVALLLLPACVESPPYDPVMSAVPEVDGVNPTPQLRVEPVPTNVQLVTLKLPDTPDCAKLTEPVGDVAPAEDVSFTVAMHVVS